MQKKRILCTSAALLAAISLIMPNQGYAKVKKPVLSKKKLTMSVGESKTLKVKNTKKKVKWSSGKKSVASVSKKGRVKAKKKGTAVITAKVAKTKLKCRVTVKAKASKKNTAKNTKPSNPSNNTPNQNLQDQTKSMSITSFRILNSTMVEVVISEAQQLPASAFTVMMKEYSSGKYNHKCAVTKISTSDQKVYTLTIDNEDYIRKGFTVKISVMTMTGELSKEAVYTGISSGSYIPETIYTYEVGDKVSEYCYLETETAGYLNVKSVQVPDGITYHYEKSEVDGYCLNFSGQPTKAGIYPYQIQYEDELGCQYTYKTTWIIGDNNTLVASMEDSYLLYTKGNVYQASNPIEVAGGSGSYTFEIADNSDPGAYIDEDYYSDDTDEAARIGFHNSTPGNKTVYVKVTDTKDTAKSVVVKWQIHVKNTFRIICNVLDSAGGTYKQARSMMLYGKEPNNYRTKFYAEYDSSKEQWYADVIEGTYSVEMSGESASEVLEENCIITKAEEKTFVLKNIYPVEITSADDLSGVFWYDEEGGSQIGRGSLLYLPKGTYYLIGKAINGMEVISQSISFQIVDSKVAVKAENLKKSNMLSGTITLDQAVQVSLKAGNSQIYNYYKFVPEESGTYAFYSESSYDTYGQLLGADYELLANNDDSGTNENFRIIYSCEAGKTYHIGIRAYDAYANGKNAELYVEKTDEDANTDDSE